MCMFVLVYAMFMCLWRTEDVRSLGAAVIGSYDLSNIGART